jgi:hypothetical protein
MEDLNKIEVPMIENPPKSTTKRPKPERVLQGKKNLMAKALRARLGIVSQAAEEAGIDRHTHGVWVEKDPLYKRVVEEIMEDLKDVAESALIALIVEKNPTIVWNFAKTKMRDRGYGEVVKHEGSIDSTMTINLIEKSVEDIKIEKNGKLNNQPQAEGNPQSS